MASGHHYPWMVTKSFSNALLTLVGHFWEREKGVGYWPGHSSDEMRKYEHMYFTRILCKVEVLIRFEPADSAAEGIESHSGERALLYDHQPEI